MTPRIRRAIEADAGLVLSSWLKSQLDASKRTSGEAAWLGALPWWLYQSEHGYRGAIVRALRDSETLVACDPEDVDVIWGWACAAPAERILHYVYVKAAFRGHGICTALTTALNCSEGSLRVTSWTPHMTSWRARGREIHYTPEALW